MKNKILIPVVAIIMVAVVVAVAIPTIEKGMASRSETDSTDDIEPGQFVKAVSTDGKPVSIPSVTYSLAEDKESYELADTTRSTSGSLRVKTPEDAEMGMRVMVSFKEPGSWLFIETIDMVMNPQMGFIVLVEDGKSLTGNTAVWIDDTGVVKTDYNVGEVTRPAGWTNYLIWGKDEKSTESYTLTNSDIYKGFVVIVKKGCNISGYNIVKFYVNSNPSINMDRPIGYTVPDVDDKQQYKKWRVWNAGNLNTGYTVSSTDAYDRSGATSKYPIYNSLTGIGIATNPSGKITVKTGYYNYSIEVKYKSKIMVDPTDYQGEYMESNIIFIVGDPDPIPPPSAVEPQVQESP